ncbi:hypothetical protein FRB94_013770 [Tulasnella sp. JGI-2019a]|nr:hypothetical protein FRB94_013770 [Tulasnella sp. JGI-2019a]
MHKSETNMSLESVISDTDSLLNPDPVIRPPVAGNPKDPSTGNEAARTGKPYKRYKKRAEFCLTLVSFLVEGTLYSIPESMFPGAGYLKSATNLASGKSEDEPVELDVTVPEMDSLMSVLLARQISTPLELTIEKWSHALGLATLWKLDAARTFIIDHISRHFPNNLADQITLADDYDVGQWLHPSYKTICIRDTPPTEEEITALGPKRLVAILKIREACRKPEPKTYPRYQCPHCVNPWTFESVNPSNPPTNLRCSSHYTTALTVAPALPATNTTTNTENADRLITVSTELVVTPGGKGRKGKRSWKVDRDSEEAVDRDECTHKFAWTPTEARFKGKGGGVMCVKICVKCGISE